MLQAFIELRNSRKPLIVKPLLRKGGSLKYYYIMYILETKICYKFLRNRAIH